MYPIFYIWDVYTVSLFPHRDCWQLLTMSTYTQKLFLILFTHNDLFVADSVSLLTEKLSSLLIKACTVNIPPSPFGSFPERRTETAAESSAIWSERAGRLIVKLVPYRPLFPTVFSQPDRITVPNNRRICMRRWQMPSPLTGRWRACCVYFSSPGSFFLFPSFKKRSGPLLSSIPRWTERTLDWILPDNCVR